MKPGIAVLLGIVIGLIGYHIYSTWGKKYSPIAPMTTPQIEPGPAPLPEAQRTADACNCQMIITTSNGTRTLYGVLQNNTCDVRSGCVGTY